MDMAGGRGIGGSVCWLFGVGLIVERVGVEVCDDREGGERLERGGGMDWIYVCMHCAGALVLGTASAGEHARGVIGARARLTARHK